MNPFRPHLERNGFVTLDGGLATALEAEGHVLDSHLWSAALLVDAPDAIRLVHERYLEAGADCITTASYQASFEGFRSLGLDDEETVGLLRRSVALALEAREAHAHAAAGRLPPLVAASVGPYGAYLADGSEYDGRYAVGRDQLDAFHRRRFGVLATAGADVLACETLPSSLEAEVLLGILDDHPDTWAWFSFSCRDGRRLHDGSDFGDVVRVCSRHPRVAAVGVNCTPPRFVEELIGRARAVAELPLIAYPNSGERYDARTRRWSGTSVDAGWVEGVERWVGAGATIVGGCCRVGPETIRAVRAALAESVRRPHT